MSRDDLVKVANSYFTGLGGNTGHNTAPFAPTCLRWENGAQTNSNPTLRPAGAGGVNIVAMSCEEQQKSGYFSFVTSIRIGVFPVVDRERGLVLSFGFFEHAGRIKEIKLTTGQTVPSPVLAPTDAGDLRAVPDRQGQDRSGRGRDQHRTVRDALSRVGRHA